jgi:hypothetical protein
MQYKDLLRGTVLLVAVEATGLAAIAAITINSTGEDALAAAALGWWIVAFGIGIWMGRPPRTRRALAGPLAAARTATQLPSESPTRIALARLWPIGLFAIIAGAAGPLWPQVPAIAAGFAIAVACAWRNRESAVTAVEDRDGIVFYVEHGSAFDPIKLIRTPGLMRGAPKLGSP